MRWTITKVDHEGRPNSAILTVEYFRDGTRKPFAVLEIQIGDDWTKEHVTEELNARGAAAEAELDRQKNTDFLDSLLGLKSG